MNLTLRDITFGYGATPLLKKISLTVAGGDFTFLLGANGSGKSTLLNLASGFLRPASGEVWLDGKNIAAWSPRARARVLAVAQQTPPPPLAFTVREIAMLGRNAYRSPFAAPDEADEAAVNKALAWLDMEKFADRAGNQLSGGERARMMLAAALAPEPQILLLDEPTAALDPAQTLNLLDVLKNLPQRPGVLMVVHDLSLVAAFAQSVVLLDRDGAIFANGATRDVFTAENITAIYGEAARFWVKK
ncbi:MAG: ABC transporter ATP-binding protein [Planctomycetota bacterium]|nr:ABC transporter ATP-binding protein [Planctomycetota bacterium]